MSWQESVDRVLQMRRVAQLEAEKAELIRIIQEAEKRCRFVVNREVSAVLKDVPSWKSEQPAQQQKPARFRGGMRTWRERRVGLEKRHRVQADKRERRVHEFEQVLNGEFGAPAGEPEPHEQSKENSDVTD